MEKFEEVADAVVRELFSSGRAKLGDDDKVGFAAADGNLMSKEEALYWRVICCTLLDQAHEKENMAATALGQVRCPCHYPFW